MGSDREDSDAGSRRGDVVGAEIIRTLAAEGEVIVYGSHLFDGDEKVYHHGGRRPHHVHVNPDHFLETPDGRVITAEKNAEAWRLAFAALDAALRVCSPRSIVYVMVGCQGSGKSTWARARHRDEPDAIVFDAILVKRSERRPILEAATRYGVPVVAVVLDTPLEACLDRNRRRPSDEVVPERNIRNVFAAVESPDGVEGFTEVIVVPYDACSADAGRWSRDDTAGR